MSRLSAVNLVELAETAPRGGIAWTSASDDLNVNLMVLEPRASIPGHLNASLDVLLLGTTGQGIVDINGVATKVRAGVCVLVPKGTRWSIQAGNEGFAYVLCHRRRPGLWPEGPVARQDET